MTCSRTVRLIKCGISARIISIALLSALFCSSAQSQAAKLSGTIRDPQGKPVASAGVRLVATDSGQTLIAHTDSQGHYSFTSLGEGVYSLKAEMAGYAAESISAIYLKSNESKTLDLRLTLGKSASTSPPEFFDQPQFVVSGVTDTTNLGGHGSDIVVRTQHTLAKETVELGKAPSPETAAAAEQEKVLRDRVEREPQNFDANHQLGKTLLAEVNADEAILYLDRAAKINPADYQNKYDLALANCVSGHLDQARQQVQSLLADHDNAELHHLLADIQERLGNPLDAVREFQRAAALDPSETYIFDWGSELLLHHAPEPAIDVFTHGSQRFPRSSRMLIGLGAAYFTRGEYDQAVKRIGQAADLDPNNPAPYQFLGRLALAQNAPPDELVDRLSRFAKLHPESAEANYYYAVALWKRRKDSDSSATVESLLNNAVRIDPHYGVAFLHLGILHSEQHDFTKAISDFREAVRFSSHPASPDLEEAHYRLAQAYRAAGQNDDAKTELKLYDQLSKQSAEKADQERHEIRQFVYTLRDQPIQSH
jgi:tetratricopeptide (TPR) repeat protein